jgi:hypothetical protein
MNKYHQIVYRYEKARLVAKKRKAHTLVFKGRWGIKDKARVSYLLSGGTDSVFEFAVKAATFKENRIQFEIGIGLSRRKEPVRREVTLSGRWNLRRGLGLVFEVSYENGKTGSIAFGADVRLTKDNTLVFKLKDDRKGRDLCVEIELSRRILEGRGEAFLRTLGSERELAVHAGAGSRW